MIKRKNQMIRAVLISVLAAGVVAGCSNPQRSGTAALEEGKYEEAARLFEEAAQSDDPKEAAEGYRGLGMASYELGDYKAALEFFEQVVDRGGEQSVSLYHLMSTCALQLEEYEKALGYVRAGIRVAQGSEGEEQTDPSVLREMRYNEILCLERQSDWETAKQKAQEYVKEYPEDEDMQKEAEFLETR